MFKNIKFSYDDLISFMNSHVQYVLEIVYRGVHYIYLYALLLIVPVYTYFYTPPLETRNFYTILNVIEAFSAKSVAFTACNIAFSILAVSPVPVPVYASISAFVYRIENSA